MADRQPHDLDTFEWALIVALRAHDGQIDKNGKDPFILHPLRVALALPKHDPELRAIAVLHDVIEDTDVSAADLALAGFGERVLDAMKILTHHRWQPYSEYVHGCGQTIDTWIVKRADVNDNADERRLDLLHEATAQRLAEKYEAALEILEDCNPEGSDD